MEYNFKKKKQNQQGLKKEERSVILNKVETSRSNQLNLQRLVFVKSKYHTDDIFSKFHMSPLPESNEKGWIIGEPKKEQNPKPIENDSDEEMSDESEDNETLVLYPTQKIELNWPTVKKVGKGIYNLGNTCFFNSVLQVMFHTPPFFMFMMEKNVKEHKQIFSKLFRHFGEQILKQTISPRIFVQHLDQIKDDFFLGLSEDCHEYFVLFVNKLEEEFLKEYKSFNLGEEIMDTNPMKQIFFGSLKNSYSSADRVSNYTSKSNECFLTLSVNVANDLKKSLNQFFSDTIIQDFKCPLTKKSIRLRKRIRIDSLPFILSIQLKRFNNSFRKISKKVRFDKYISLNKYYNKGNHQKDIKYELYALIIHEGSTLSGGHYYAYIKASNGFWYCFNDSSVNRVTEQRVLRSNPYLLYYKVLEKPIHRINKKEKQFIPQRSHSLNTMFKVQKQEIVKETSEKEKNTRTIGPAQLKKRKIKTQKKKEWKKKEYENTINKSLNSLYGQGVTHWEQDNNNKENEIGKISYLKQKNQHFRDLKPKVKKRDEFFQAMDKGKLPKTKEEREEILDRSKQFDSFGKRKKNYRGKNNFKRNNRNRKPRFNFRNNNKKRGFNNKRRSKLSSWT